MSGVSSGYHSAIPHQLIETFTNRPHTKKMKYGASISFNKLLTMILRSHALLRLTHHIVNFRTHLERSNGRKPNR
jgi:hypothetical protein